jgi:hypothetical protein
MWGEADPTERPALPAEERLKRGFLRWQCRVRQLMMREERGRPVPGIMPSVTLEGETQPLGHIITVLSKLERHSKTPELRHIAQRTHDPAQRREAALTLLGEFHYQKPEEFSDLLTATFPPGSPGAARIRASGTCVLGFDAYRQRFELRARVWQLTPRHAAWAATWWHNLLFNPALPPDTVIVAFEPDWRRSTADPMPA